MESVVDKNQIFDVIVSTKNQVASSKSTCERPNICSALLHKLKIKMDIKKGKLWLDNHRYQEAKLPHVQNILHLKN
jgi:hypothetical protein